MILIDHTEIRKDTRLPQAVISASQVIIGLERLTGADFVISPLSEPVLPETLKDSKPHVKALMKHTKAGVLVQRKSGMDLLSSLRDLCTIQKRMQDWCGPIPPWLLVTGQLSPKRDGGLTVNNQDVSTSYSYKAIKAALDWWQLRGGGVSELFSDKRITTWVNHWHQEMLHRLDESPERIVLNLPPAQTIRGEEHWWTALAAVPGIGPTRAQAIAEWLPDEWQGLAHALYCLSDIESITLPGRPKGVGVKTVQAMRDWLGIEDDEVVVVKKREEPL